MTGGAGRRAAVAAVVVGGTMALVAVAAVDPSPPPVRVDRRVTLTGDPSCILGSALPAGTEPAPVPPPEPAATSSDGSWTVMTGAEPTGTQTVALMVQPDAGMAQRVQELVGVPVQEDYQGRLLRFRIEAEAWQRVSRRIDYLPGVWGASLTSAPVIEGSQPADPEAAIRQQLDQAAESAANLRAECDRKLREATLAASSGGRSCPTRAEMAERRRKAAVAGDLLRRVVDNQLLAYLYTTSEDTVTVLAAGPGTDPAALQRAAGVAPAVTRAGDLRLTMPPKDLNARLLAIAAVPGVKRLLLDRDTPEQDGTKLAFVNLAYPAGEPAPQGCPPDGR